MSQAIYSLRHVLVQLVKGALYQEDAALWSLLLRERHRVESHFHLMGLDLVIDEDAGYAFLRNEGGEDEDEGREVEGEAALPRLMRRNPLSFLPTVLLVELRERLLRHDQSADGTDHLFLEFREILEFMAPYCGDTGNEKKVEKKVSAAISRLLDLSVLRQIPNRSEVIYRVEPILRAKLPVEQIEEIRERFKAHLDKDEEPEESENGESEEGDTNT